MLRKSAIPPGPKGNWLLGSTPEFAKDQVAYLAKYCPQYPDGIMTSMHRMANLFVAWDPKWAKHVLQDNAKNYQKGRGYEFLRPMLGNGLLNSEGEFWRQQRRLINPAFSKKKVAEYAKICTDAGERCRERLGILADSGQHADMHAEMARVTMEILSEAVFGSQLEGDRYSLSKDLEEANRDAILRINHPFMLPMWVPTPYNLSVQGALKRLQAAISQFVKDRKANPGPADRKRDLLDSLLEARDSETGKAMDAKQIRDEIATIFIAGHETTANAMAWTFHCLDRFPEVDAKLRAEVATLQGRTPTLEDIPNLSYTQLVVKEALRLYPPAWVIGRKNMVDDEIAGYHIPKESNVLIPVVYMQRNPEYWPDPLEFRPERHQEERVKKLPKYAYFPFGAGPRICVGMNMALLEMHLLLPQLISGFRYETEHKTPRGQDALITLHPKDGVPLRVRRAAVHSASHPQMHRDATPAEAGCPLHQKKLAEE